MTIRTLPNDILIEIFGFYRKDENNYDNWWHTVVHVCQRWQNVVFASLQHLELRLHCIGIRSVRDMLDIWLEFPIIIDGLNDVDNVIAALK